MSLFFRKRKQFCFTWKIFFYQERNSWFETTFRDFSGASKRKYWRFYTFLKKENEEIRSHFVYYIQSVFLGKKFHLLYRSQYSFRGLFFPELRKDFSKILPPVEDENTVSYVISNAFFRDKSDFKFIKNISRKQSDELFRLLEIDNLLDLPKVKKELLSMNILAWRVIGNALEVDVLKWRQNTKFR